jgi:DMSO reductase anchor subunit
MRPTFSIICFTVLSGIGYGTWFLFGLAMLVGPICEPPWIEKGLLVVHCRGLYPDPVGFLLAFLLVGVGLLCSLGHLGKPLRAWRALSQWRSSWLSREGVLALLTFVPATVLLVDLLIALLAHLLQENLQASPGWLVVDGFAWRMCGAALAFGSFATVYCTANIYSSLKPIRAWRDSRVVPGYLLLSLLGGTLLLTASGTLFAAIEPGWRVPLFAGVLGLAIVCAWLKLGYWRAIDALPAPDAGHATGLSSLGEVRSFEAPHTEENYLTHEMGFVLARKHARKLRRIALIFAFLLPGLLALSALVVPAIGMPAAWLALAAGITGLFVERWLFFAEARHAVIAYYAR